MQVAGRLHIELARVSGSLPERPPDEISSESSGESGHRNSFVELEEETGVTVGSTIVCKVRHNCQCHVGTWQPPEAFRATHKPKFV